MFPRQKSLPALSCRHDGFACLGVLVALGGLASLGAGGLGLVSGLLVLGVGGGGALLSAILFVKLKRERRVLTQLGEQAERCLLLGQASGDLVWDWKPKADLFWWNESYARVLGVPPGAQPSFETWKRHIGPRDRDRVLLDLNRTLEGGATQWRCEYTVSRKDGGEGVLMTRALIMRDAAGAAVRVVASMMDITERRRQEWERTRLSVAVSQSTELVAVLATDGTVSYVNPAFKVITGIDLLGAAGRAYDFMQKPGRNGIPFAEVASRVASAGSWSRRMDCSRRGEGGDYVLQVTITAIHGTSSHAEGYLLIGRDVTRELRAEDQARLAHKMEAVGLLAGGVAHDFNNVLQVINGYVELLSDPGIGEEERREAVEEIATAAHRASQFTKQLQLFSRRQTLVEDSFDLGRLVADMHVLLLRMVGEGVSFEHQTVGGECGVHADRSQVELVVTNLFLNARDATPAGGRITITVGPVHLSESACEDLPWARPGDFVMLEVADTGCGMDHDTLARIYEPFFSTKPKGKGLGLGLPIVYGIVQRHGGLLDVESEPGLGTRFRVYLPRCETGGAPQPEPAESVVALTGSGLILLAEDDADVRELVRRSLEKVGFDVLCAEDGEEAVRVFLENKPHFRLAILDGAMPKLSGQEVHARIVKERPELPVIRCSGYSSGGTQSESMQTPLCQIIQKPYDIEILLRKISLMLADSSS